MELLKKEIAIIAGIEIAFGLIEGIAIPNIVERKKGEKFFIPDGKTILKTAGALTVTGLISGLIADTAIKKMNLKEGKERTTAIAVSAIAVNVIEAIVVPNFVNQKLNKDFKLKMPKAAIFFGSFMVLSATAFAGGYIADNTIAYFDRKEREAQQLADKK